MSKLLQRNLRTTLGQRIVNNCSALTNQLKLREDNYEPIEMHPELNCASSSQLCVSDQKLFKNFGREQANAPIVCRINGTEPTTFIYSEFTFFMGHMGVCRKSPNDAPWGTLNQIDSVGQFPHHSQQLFCHGAEKLCSEEISSQQHQSTNFCSAH